MGKPVFGLILGGILGIFDGLTALISAPEVKSEILMIVVGSMGKGLLGGVIIGYIAKKFHNLPLGVLIGGLVTTVITDAGDQRQYLFLGDPHSRNDRRIDRRLCDPET
jgi:hypothetical protein